MALKRQSIERNKANRLKLTFSSKVETQRSERCQTRNETSCKRIVRERPNLSHENFRTASFSNLAFSLSLIPVMHSYAKNETSLAFCVGKNLSLIFFQVFPKSHVSKNTSKRNAACLHIFSY